MESHNIGPAPIGGCSPTVDEQDVERPVQGGDTPAADDGRVPRDSDEYLLPYSNTDNIVFCDAVDIADVGLIAPGDSNKKLSWCWQPARRI